MQTEKGAPGTKKVTTVHLWAPWWFGVGILESKASCLTPWDYSFLEQPIRCKELFYHKGVPSMCGTVDTLFAREQAGNCWQSISSHRCMAFVVVDCPSIWLRLREKIRIFAVVMNSFKTNKGK